MPVRRRNDKRRNVGTLDDWCEAFDFGYDACGDLKYCGIWTDERGYPDQEEARAAWKRFGRAFLEEWASAHPNGPGRAGPPWALTEFGEP